MSTWLASQKAKHDWRSFHLIKKLGEMGRNSICQKYHDEPGKCSKLWVYTDIDHVLKNNTVRGYLLELIIFLFIHQS